MYLNFTLRISVVVLALTLCVGAVLCDSELIVHEIDSKEIAGNLAGISNIRKIQVYLPDGYQDKVNRRYPALYWIPGWMSGYQHIINLYRNALDEAIESKSMIAPIVVFILHSAPLFWLFRVFRRSCETA